MTATKFIIGRTYFTRSICDHDTIYRETIVARTDKTVTTAKGKKFRINVYNGVETFKPHGSYSMAATISADKFFADESEQAEALQPAAPVKPARTAAEAYRANVARIAAPAPAPVAPARRALPRADVWASLALANVVAVAMTAPIPGVEVEGE